MKFKLFLFIILITSLCLLTCKKYSSEDVSPKEKEEKFITDIKNIDAYSDDVSNDKDDSIYILEHTDSKGRTEILKLSEIIKLLEKEGIKN